MARYTVSPDGPGWAVYRNGRRRYKKTYQTKRAAIEAAHRDAEMGDSVQGRRVDGTYGPERTHSTPGPRGDQ